MEWSIAAKEALSCWFLYVPSTKKTKASYQDAVISWRAGDRSHPFDPSAEWKSSPLCCLKSETNPLFAYQLFKVGQCFSCGEVDTSGHPIGLVSSVLNVGA